METFNKERQAAVSPDQAIVLLEEGNQRFQLAKKADRDLLDQVNKTCGGQFPFGVVISCIDSRVPVEHVFDMGIGDLFSVRVAGNVINEDVLGSTEYGCKVAGSKLVLVMGHTKCGAVTSACHGVELGNITALLSKIQPAVNGVEKPGGVVTADYIEDVNKLNIHNAIKEIRDRSQILKEMEMNGEIKMVGAVYDVCSGAVEFLDTPVA